jgi:hypothetical protein
VEASLEDNLRILDVEFYHPRVMILLHNIILFRTCQDSKFSNQDEVLIIVYTKIWA